MKKIISTLSGIAVIATLISFNPAMAQTSNESQKSRAIISSEATPEEIERMSAIVADMAAQIENGNITPETQATTAQILNHVSHILSVMAGTESNVNYSITRQEIKEEITKWNLWEEMEEH